MRSIPKAQRALVGVLLALLVAIGFVLLGTKSASVRPTALSNPKSQFDGPTMAPHLRAANFSLLDQGGRRVTLSHYRGRVVVLTFIHSLCHDACPFMVEQIKGALNQLPDNGVNVPTIGVSVEPAQDTVKNRDAFLAKHQMASRMSFLNGPMSVMRRVWHAYAINPVTPNVDHSTFVLLIDKRGYERVGFPADELTPEALAHDITVLERQAS